MKSQEELNIHKAKIEILLALLPFAIPRFNKILFFKKENKLNTFISSFIGKSYILDLLENEEKFLDNSDLYRNICEAYDYILNVVDSASVVYEEKEVEKIKNILNLK